jgi:outer membrane protein TolC
MKTVVLILASIFSLGLSAQEMTLSLEEAMNKALTMNRNVQISELEIEKAERVVKETLAIGLPQINASGEFQNFLDIPTTVLPDFISPSVYGVLISEGLLPPGSGGQSGLVPAQFGTEYNLTGSATLSQLLFSGSYLIGLQATKSYVELSQVQKMQTDLEVKKGVADAYYAVLVSEQNLEVLNESQATLAKTLAEVQAMYEEGFVEEQDAEQLQLTLNTINSQRANAERQLGLTKKLLNFQIGLPLETQVTLTDNAESISATTAMNEDMVLAEPNMMLHPDYLLTENNEVLQQLRLREQKSRYWPTLNGFFSYSRAAQRNEFNFFDSDQEWFPATVWGLNLNVPIFSSGMKANKVKQIEIDVKEAALMKEQAADGLKMSATQAKSNFIYAKDNYEVEKESLALAERIRNKTRIKYQEGLSSSFELNQMETQYLETQGRFILATLNLLNSSTELKKAFGRL